MKKSNAAMSLILAITAFLIFFVFFALVLTKNEGLYFLDNSIAKIFSDNRLRIFDYIFVIISYLGERYTITILCIVLLILPNRRELGIPVTILTSISFAINLIIKYSIMRARPDGYFLTLDTLGYSMPTSYSFPSGHAQTANIFYFSVAMLSLRYFRKDYQKILSMTFVTCFCISMNIARLYLGVHYLSDVVAGIDLAICILSLAIFFSSTTNKCSLNIYE